MAESTRLTISGSQAIRQIRCRTESKVEPCGAVTGTSATWTRTSGNLVGGVIVVERDARGLQLEPADISYS